MPHNLNAEVATLKERIDNAKEHLGDKIDGIEETLSSFIERQEYKQEQWWQEFRRFENKTKERFEEAAKELSLLGVDIKNNKKHCDDRFGAIEKEKRSVAMTQKLRIGALVSVISTTATILANFGIVVFKRYWSNA